MDFAQKFRKVLIIDDDPIFIEILAAFFMKRGTSTVVAAADGKQAALALAQNSATLDLITSDLNMPATDGVEFLTHLSSKRETRIPLVILSAADRSILDASGKLAEAYGLHFLGSLPKPLNSKALENLLLPLLKNAAD